MFASVLMSTEKVNVLKGNLFPFFVHMYMLKILYGNKCLRVCESPLKNVNVLKGNLFPFFIHLYMLKILYGNTCLRVCESSLKKVNVLKGNLFPFFYTHEYVIEINI